MEPISLTIDVTKLKKDAFYKGAKGTYVTLTVWPTKDGMPDQYGNDASVKQDLGKDRRDEKAPYIGNAKIIKRKNSAPPPKNYEKLPTKQEAGDEDFIPF